jgi:hypothetical protein
LTETQFRIVLAAVALGAEPGRGVTVAELAAAVDRKPASVAGAVRDLRDRLGLARRDGRAVYFARTILEAAARYLEERAPKPAPAWSLPRRPVASQLELDLRRTA